MPNSDKTRNIAIGADHAAFSLKEKIKGGFQDLGFRIQDCGTDSTESVDYPDFADKVAEEIIAGRADTGILLCGSGIGMSIAANRHAQIRAALCHDAETARLAREHNDANILVLGSRLIDEKTALECVRIFLETKFAGGRHQARVAKLSLPKP